MTLPASPRSRMFGLAVIVLLTIAALIWLGSSGADPVSIDADAPRVTQAVDATSSMDPSPVPSDAAALPGARIEVEAAADPDRTTIRGRVVDRFDQPIEGVEVHATISLFPTSRRTDVVRSNAAGEFVLEALHPGRARIHFSHPDYCEVTTKSQPIERGDRIDLGSTCLYHGTEVSGYARVDGEPAPGLQLWLLGANDDGARRSQPGAAVVAGRDGFFKLRERQPPGRYCVIAMPALQFGPFANLSPARVVAAEFDLVAGESFRVVQVELQSRR